MKFTPRRVRGWVNRLLRERSLRRGYEPSRYWGIWGRVFASEEYQKRILPQHEWLWEQISAAKPATVLEVGCGFGRNLRFLRDRGIPEHSLAGVDVSDTMLKQARHQLKGADLRKEDARRLPFEPAAFDLVFTMGLCMHIPPPEVRECIRGLARVARRDVVLIEEWYPDKRGAINPYTFVHDYDALARKLGLAIADRQAVRNNEQMLCLRLAAPPAGLPEGTSKAAGLSTP
jgi:SAM-dependent methyltransferase